MEVIEQLQNYRSIEKNCVVERIYWAKREAVKVESETCVFYETERSIRQESVLSPDLFGLYNETIL